MEVGQRKMWEVKGGGDRRNYSDYGEEGIFQKEISTTEEGKGGKEGSTTEPVGGKKEPEGGKRKETGC